MSCGDVVQVFGHHAVYIFVSKFGDALGVELEPVFSGINPILNVEH